MRLNINIDSLRVYQGYKNNLSKSNTAMERIASGLQINSAKDNPIKLEKSENIKMQLKSLESAEKNLQNCSSMLQTADTAMSTISEVLIRMKELTIQAISDACNEEDRMKIQNELNELAGQINEVSDKAEFNGNKLLSGINNGADKIDHKVMQAGTSVGETIKIPYFTVNTKTLELDNISVISNDDANKAIENVTSAISILNSYRSQYGALQNRIESSCEMATDSYLSLESTRSRIIDADFAEEVINLSTADILIQSSTAILAQSNQFPKDVLNILSKLM